MICALILSEEITRTFLLRLSLSPSTDLPDPGINNGTTIVMILVVGCWSEIVYDFRGMQLRID